jgi:hypothetical protein
MQLFNYKLQSHAVSLRTEEFKGLKISSQKFLFNRRGAFRSQLTRTKIPVTSDLATIPRVSLQNKKKLICLKHTKNQLTQTPLKVNALRMHFATTIKANGNKKRST